MLSGVAIGSLAAVGSALAFGSFAVPIKCKQILDAKVRVLPEGTAMHERLCIVLSDYRERWDAGAIVDSIGWLLQVDPFCYQVYKSFTCCITSFLILTYTPFRFTYWGIVGGLIWVGHWPLRCVKLSIDACSFALPGRPLTWTPGSLR